MSSPQILETDAPTLIAEPPFDPVQSFEQSSNKDRLIAAYGKTMVYLKGLTFEQRNFLSLGPHMVEWLNDCDVEFREDPSPYGTVSMHAGTDVKSKKGHLVIQSAHDFRNVSDRALAWGLFYELKNVDIDLKGQHRLVDIPIKDINEHYIDKISTAQKPFVGKLMTMALQLVLSKEAAEDTVGGMILPILGAQTHKEICRRGDLFATRVTGMSFKEYADDLKQVTTYAPVFRTLDNFLYNGQLTDKTREWETDLIKQGVPDFRRKYGLPGYEF